MGYLQGDCIENTRSSYVQYMTENKIMVSYLDKF